jgi:RepB DNA-primase N-terminal domain
VHNHSDTKRFLQAVFGTDWASSAIFADYDRHAVDPYPKMRHKRSLDELDPTLDCYFSIAAFPPHAKRNLKALALEVRTFVIDDVGSKVSAAAVERALGRPTAAVETSPGNFQWAYRLSKPVPVDDWGTFFDAVEARVGERFDRATRDPVHLFRLPMGMNTKPEHNQ